MYRLDHVIRVMSRDPSSAHMICLELVFTSRTFSRTFCSAQFCCFTLGKFRNSCTVDMLHFELLHCTFAGRDRRLPVWVWKLCLSYHWRDDLVSVEYMCCTNNYVADAVRQRGCVSITVIRHSFGTLTSNVDMIFTAKPRAKLEYWYNTSNLLEVSCQCSLSVLLQSKFKSNKTIRPSQRSSSIDKGPVGQD